MTRLLVYHKLSVTSKKIPWTVKFLLNVNTIINLTYIHCNHRKSKIGIQNRYR